MMRMLTAGLIPYVALVACGGGGTEPAPLPSLSFTGGASQTDTVGRTLPALQVRLTDANSGAPLVGYVINWSAPDGGSLFVPVTQTGTNGTTSNVFTLGNRAGTQPVVARYIDPRSGAPVTVDTAHMTALPGWAAAIQLFPGVTQAPSAIHVGDTATFVVLYQDFFANYGGPCPDGHAWEDLTWDYDMALVRLVDITRSTAGAATRFEALQTGGAFFTVTTQCALPGVRTVSTNYSLPINP